MKIAIVGGSGFVGSNLARQLDNATIVDIVKPPDSLRAVYPVDVTDENSIRGVFSWLKPDIVYYLAAVIRSDDCRLDPVTASKVNIQGLVNTLQACVDSKVSRIIYSSTIHNYANVESDPISEDVTIPFPDHIYPCTKLIGEKLIMSFNEMYDLPYTILRYGVVLGPGGHSDMVAHSFINRYINDETLILNDDGSTKRCFVYIDDLTRGNIAALDVRAENQIFNICDDRVVSIRDIAKMVSALEDKPIKTKIGKPRPGDFKGARILNNKARDILGWRPSVTLEEGIKRYYKWIKDSV